MTVILIKGHHFLLCNTNSLNLISDRVGSGFSPTVGGTQNLVLGSIDRPNRLKTEENPSNLSVINSLSALK
jgi:hypothetical protein